MISWRRCAVPNVMSIIISRSKFSFPVARGEEDMGGTQSHRTSRHHPNQDMIPGDDFILYTSHARTHALDAAVDG
jgi:hypothetical protein